MRSKFTANLLKLVLLLATLATTVCAQEKPKPKQPDPKAIADILNRIKDLEQEVNNLRGDQSVFLTLEDPYLGMSYSNSKRQHFFVARLVVVNLSSAKVVIKRDDIVLETPTDTFKYSEIPSSLRYQSVPNGRQTTQLGSIEPRAELSIAPAASGSTWIRYVEIPTGADIPKMTVKVNGKHPASLNVNKQARQQLGLTVEQIGPRGSLAMLTVSGSINPINAGSIVDEITQMIDQKVVRAVIRWTDAAPVLSSQANSWLQTSAANAGKQVSSVSRSNAFPMMPIGLRELHLSSIPGKSTSYRSTSTAGRIHKDDLSAVTAALKTAYERVPLPEVLADIENGSRLTRIAAISCGGGRLPIEKLPLLLKLADDDNPRIQQAAINALGHFGETEAVEKLERYVRANIDPVSEVAITSLARSRFPAAHEKLLGILKNETPETRKRIVALLAKNPRTAWADAIYEFASDPNSGLVIESTQALSKIGHPKLVELLATGLKSSDKKIVDESFRLLSSRMDAESEKLAMDHMLVHMEKLAPTSQMLTLVTRTRDQRALPKLLHYFEKAKSSRQGLINAIAKVGDETIVKTFVKQFPRLSSSEKTSVMTALAALDWKEYRRLAGETLASNSSDSTLVSASTKALQEDGSEEAIEMLTQAFIKSTNSNSWNYISRALSELRTPSAREGLYRAMDATDSKQKLQYIETARRNMLSRSSGYRYWTTGQQKSEKEDYKGAITDYNQAISVDPGLPEAYSSRGYSYLKQSKYDDAITDFKKALTLDARNGLAKAGTSIALVEQGKLEEGVKQVEFEKEKFKSDKLFAYNTSCVYGTAMKQMKARDAKADESKTFKDYQKRALEELERSIEMGFKEAELIHSDPDLDLLRDLPEYQSIVKTLPKPKPAPKVKPPVPGEKPVLDPKAKIDAVKDAAKAKVDAIKAAAEAAAKVEAEILEKAQQAAEDVRK